MIDLFGNQARESRIFIGLSEYFIFKNKSFSFFLQFPQLFLEILWVSRDCPEKKPEATARSAQVRLPG